MPQFRKSLRAVLDAEANTTSNNPNSGIYSDDAHALCSDLGVMHIGDFATRAQQLNQFFGNSPLAAGGVATASIEDASGVLPHESGVVTDSTVPGFGIMTSVPLDVGLKHYHHQCQFLEHLDSTFDPNVSIDVFDDNFNRVTPAGGGQGSYKQFNIGLNSSHVGIEKKTPVVSGGNPYLVNVAEELVGLDGLSVTNGTGYMTDDGVAEQLGQTGTTEISIGAFSDPFVISITIP
jgi:hypothetical protein